MAIEYKLKYTGAEIDEKLEQVGTNKANITQLNEDIGNIGGTVEVTSGEPTKENTVVTISPSSETTNIYTAEEVDAKFEQMSEEIANKKVFVTPEMYGAKGDGVTDDSSAFNNMLASNNRLIVLAPNKTYFLNTELPVITNITIDLNKASIETNNTLRLGDGCTITNGIIRERSILDDIRTVISVEGTDVSISRVSFESLILGCHYITTRENSDRCNISNCHFDGQTKIGVLVCGNHCTIENCYFEPSNDNDLYSNCIKFSADNCVDDVTPCARNSYVKNCYFGWQSDNCIDCYTGAIGLIVENCVFDNGDKVGIDIQNKYRSPDANDYELGTSKDDLRVCRNVKIIDCEFLGTETAVYVTATAEAGYSEPIQPVKNVVIEKCVFHNVNKPFFVMNENVSGFVIDSPRFEKMAENTYVYLYGVNDKLLNVDCSYIIVNLYGKAKMENCKLHSYQLVGNNADVFISNCSAYSGSYLLAGGGGKKAIVDNCDSSQNNYLVALTGNSPCIIVRNSIAKTLVNNGYEASDGNVYLLNNLYTVSVKPSVDNSKGIALDNNNNKIII